jgi:hypothetical protein
MRMVKLYLTITKSPPRKANSIELRPGAIEKHVKATDSKETVSRNQHAHLADITRACFKVGCHPKGVHLCSGGAAKERQAPTHLAKVIEKPVVERLADAVETHALVRARRNGWIVEGPLISHLQCSQ